MKVKYRHAYKPGEDGVCAERRESGVRHPVCRQPEEHELHGEPVEQLSRLLLAMKLDKESWKVPPTRTRQESNFVDLLERYNDLRAREQQEEQPEEQPEEHEEEEPAPTLQIQAGVPD